MPNKIGDGGVTPFTISTKPNIFTPLRNEELLERRGESALWFRLTQCPCPQELRVPDCKFCNEGQMKTFQEDLLIEEEISWKLERNRVYVRYGPIKSVKRIFLIYRETQKELQIVNIHPSYIEVSENLEYYHQVQIDYFVSLIEESTFETECNGNIVYPGIVKKGISKAIEAIDIQTGDSIPILSWSITSLVLSKPVYGLIRIKAETFQTIKVAYKTFTQDERQSGVGKSLVELPDGEVLAVMGAGYRLGEGDILIMQKSTLRHSMYVKYQNGNFDRMPYSPIASIDSVISRDESGFKKHKPGIDFVPFGENKIHWIKPKPLNGYSIVYDYFPTFRVTSMVETGMGEDRSKPRQFKMKAIPSMQAR